MTDIYDWLKNTEQPSYAPTSPPFGPMDENPFADTLMDEATLLDTDENDNMYFDMPDAWDAPFEQSRTDVGPFPIDPSLAIMTEPSAPTTSGQAFVMVPEQFAETSRKILVYLAQVLDIPEDVKDLDNGLTGEMTFTADELEILEPIIEEDPEPPIPNIINGVCVNQNPQSIEIKNVIDLCRIGPNRRTYYLARTIDGDYYWFHIPRAERDHHFRQLIGDYRYKSHMETDGRKGRDVKRLRNGKTVEV